MSETNEDNKPTIEEVLAQPESVELVKRAAKVAEEATPLLIIRNDDEYEHAAEVLKRVKTLFSDAEDRRKFLVKPLNDHVKTINDASKKITEPLAKQEKAIKDAMVVYYTAKEVAAAAERNRLALAAAAAQDELNKEAELLNVEAPILNIPTVLEPERTIVGVTMKGQWVGEVENLALVPDQFKMIDQVKLNAAVNAGERSIPGVKIYKKLVASARKG